jgi:hypothetical protein
MSIRPVDGAYSLPTDTFGITVVSTVATNDEAFCSI